MVLEDGLSAQEKPQLFSRPCRRSAYLFWATFRVRAGSRMPSEPGFGCSAHYSTFSLAAAGGVYFPKSIHSCAGPEPILYSRVTRNIAFYNPCCNREHFMQCCASTIRPSGAMLLHVFSPRKLFRG